MAEASAVREASACLYADLHSRFAFDFDADGNEDGSGASVGPSSRPSRFETQLRKMLARSVGGGVTGDDDVGGGGVSDVALPEPAPRGSPETSGSIYLCAKRTRPREARPRVRRRVRLRSRRATWRKSGRVSAVHAGARGASALMSDGSSTPGEEPDEENPFAGPSEPSHAGPSRAGPSRARSDGVRYAAVGRIVGRMFLCWHHHPLLDGDWGPTPQQLHAVAQRVLRSATTLERFPRLSVSDPAAGMVHYDTDGTYVYLVVCAANYPQRVAFKCLAELKAAIPANFGERMHTAAEGGLNKGAKKLLAEVHRDIRRDMAEKSRCARLILDTGATVTSFPF